jgi:hypothetical protein
MTTSVSKHAAISIGHIKNPDLSPEEAKDG